jgi:hypothetical protein
MQESTPPQQNPGRNSKKYMNYTEAWAQIKKALDHAFYFEAVTLEESIMSDRLISYLALTRPEKRHPSFGELIGSWRQKIEDNKDDKPSYGNFSDLISSVDNWRIARNKVVHGIVKSYVDTEPEDITSLSERSQSLNCCQVWWQKAPQYWAGVTPKTADGPAQSVQRCNNISAPFSCSVAL